MEDVVGLALLAIDDPSLQGPMNATAPEPATNRELSTAIRHVPHRPSVLPVPGFALRLVLGDAAEMVLTGQRVVPSRALAEGYFFVQPALEGALRHLLGAS